MLFQRFMTGRGNLGYGFRAQTARVPITPFLKLRASDTGDTKRFLLEILTTKYHEIAVAGSCFDREQSNGYTDILFADSKGEAEWQAILDNPGRLLYLPHISKADFLETSNKGKTVALGAGVEMAIPQITHKWDQRFHVDEDVLADLAADVWYAASMRLTAADRPGSWPVVNICLTEEDERDDTLEIGREFYCNVLMPALPRSLRSIVSVSIGGRYGDVSNAANGGAAAVLITLPEEKSELLPGTYVLTPTVSRHQPLNPFQAGEDWRNFGHAILHYAKNGLEEKIDTERYLNDFFAASELIASKEEYQSLRYLTANWPYAFLLYNGHLGCEAALQQTGEYASDAAADDLQASFDENIWESADPAFLKEFGIPEKEARNCYIWLEQHMLEALLANSRIQITLDRYVELARRAFTLQQLENAELRAEMQDQYDGLLLRGTAEAGSNVLELLLGLTKHPELSALLANQRAHMSALLERALAEYLDQMDQPFGDEDVSRAVAVLESGYPECAERMLEALCDLFENALPDMFEQGRRTVATAHKVVDECWSSCIKHSTGEMSEKLRCKLADRLRDYVAKERETMRYQMPNVVQAFRDLGMDSNKDEAFMQALCACMEVPGEAFTEQDANDVLPVLRSGKPEARRMADAVLKTFAEGVPVLLEEKDDPETHPWKLCIHDIKPSEAQQQLAQAMREYLRKYAEEKPEKLVSHLGRAMELFKAYGYVDTEQIVNIFCKIISCQVKQLDEEAILAEQDLRVINSLDLKNVSDESKEALADALHALFARKLPYMAKDNGACDRWRNLLKNKYLGDSLKAKSQQTFAGFVDKQTQRVKDENAEDCLGELLEIVNSLEWSRVEVVRKAVAGYFAVLERSALSKAEIDGLLSMHSNTNREIPAGLCDVFCRSIPRMLAAGGEQPDAETMLWAPVVQTIDLRDAFQKTIQRMRTDAGKENAAMDETFILSLISFGDALEPLLATATEQAISIIEERKATQRAVASELLSADEHMTVLSAVRACGSQTLLCQYIDLLAYEPTDAENEENEKLLRKKMKEMRESLFLCMNVEAATYAIKKSPIWQAEVQQALLGRLESMTQAEGMTFQNLCELPSRWAVECQNWRFVQFTDLSRYVPERKLLEDAVSEGAQKVIRQSLLEELKNNLLQNVDSWYASLISTLVAQRAGMDVRLLAEECETPQAVKDLLEILNQTNAEVSQETTEALNLIRYGGKDENALVTLAHLRDLGSEAMSIGVVLLRKAVFGGHSDQWRGLWDAHDCSGRIPLAAICYLSDRNKMWNEFFHEILQDTSMDKQALSAGTDPVQALMFASSVLCDMGLTREADEMVEQLKAYRREEYAYVRAIGRRRKELAALKEPSAWKATGAAENLHQLIFNKH